MNELPFVPEVAPEVVAWALRAFPPDTAPQKPDGRVRPIAVGEILRRLTGKCLMGSVKEEARSHFWPAQAGVAVCGGAECIIHTVRAWYQRHHHSYQKVVLKLDFSNAFHSVSRDAVSTAVRSHFPLLSRWATWCYKQPTGLQFATWGVDSSAGVQQGDPLGPLLFAAALQPLASDLRNLGLDIAVHYLDDGVLASDIAAVGRALRVVEARSAAIGLQLNLAKCELVAVGSTEVAALHCHFPDALPRDSAGACTVKRHFDLLGGSVGDEPFVRARAAERAAKAGGLAGCFGRA